MTYIYPVTNAISQPFQIPPAFRQRVWGRRSLQPFFDQVFENPVGEVWFQYEGDPQIFGAALDPQHPRVCPLLVKFLFTSDRLSVQVHPDDEYARQHHQSLGKTEAWYVLDSQPPGEVAAGFREPLSPEKLKTAAQTGEIEHLLDWKKVHAGDVIFTPAGTVHAIGAGLTICEIQQNSDITYRLYDYGRPRELHLDHGARVSHLGLQGDQPKPISLNEWRDELVASRYFRIERLRSLRPLGIPEACPYYLLLICIRGHGIIGKQPFAAGQAWFVPARNTAFTIEGDADWILTYKSEMRAEVMQSSSASGH